MYGRTKSYLNCFNPCTNEYRDSQNQINDFNKYQLKWYYKSIKRNQLLFLFKQQQYCIICNKFDDQQIFANGYRYFSIPIPSNILRLHINKPSLLIFSSVYSLFKFQIVQQFNYFPQLELIEMPSNSFKENQLHCEKCFTISNEANLCHCLTLLCVSCIHTHNCQKSHQFIQEDRNKSQPTISISEFGKEYIEPIPNNSTSLLFQLKQSSNNNINCQRCHSKEELKHCLECRISNLCSYCFNQLHRTKKMAMHQFQEIHLSKDKKVKFDRKICLSNIRVLDQSNTNEDKKLLTTINKQKSIQKSNLSEFEQKTNDKVNKIEKISIMNANINFLKLQMQEQRKRIQTKEQQTLSQIMKDLDDLILQVKQKKVEFEIYCKQQLGNELKVDQQLNKMIAQSLTSIGNMNNLINHSINQPSMQLMLQEKIQIQTQRISKITEQCQYHKIFDCKYRISDQFQSQISQIKEAIKKIEAKKIIHQKIIQFQKPSLNIIPCKSEKSSLMAEKLKNELKNMKKQFTLTSCKSSDYLNPFTHSLLFPPPKSKTGNNKSHIIKKTTKDSLNASVNQHSNLNCSLEEEKYLKNSSSVKNYYLPKLGIKQSQIKFDPYSKKNAQIKKGNERGGLKKIHKHPQSWRVNQTTTTPTHKTDNTKKFIASIRQYSNRSNIDVGMQYAFKELQTQKKLQTQFETFITKSNNKL